MERLKHMKEMLMAQVEGQLGNLQQVDAEELGEVVDMIKDLDEAIYYCTVTKVMEEAEKKPQTMYYTPMYYDPRMNKEPWEDRDMDKSYGRMYYTEGSNSSSSGRGGNNGQGGSRGNSGSSRQYTEMEYPVEWRDMREGRSPISRKMYMESKEMHKGKITQLKDLEKYVQELTSDLIEMVEDASPEEQQYLANKMSTLSTKISTLSKDKE